MCKNFIFKGCADLRHLECETLNLHWPSKAPHDKYFDFASAPIDCAFVAMLIYLPSLRALITEVGGRAIKVSLLLHNIFFAISLLQSIILTLLVVLQSGCQVKKSKSFLRASWQKEEARQWKQQKRH